MLDFERRSYYRIPLLVSDAAGRRAFATLTLNVIDENDNTPKFVAKKYRASIASTAQHGDTIMTVSFPIEIICNKFKYSKIGHNFRCLLGTQTKTIKSNIR